MAMHTLMFKVCFHDVGQSPTDLYSKPFKTASGIERIEKKKKNILGLAVIKLFFHFTLLELKFFLVWYKLMLFEVIRKCLL